MSDCKKPGFITPAMLDCGWGLPTWTGGERRRATHPRRRLAGTSKPRQTGGLVRLADISGLR
eukprot:3163093-Lingulodinium_polyedra.AAC.1